MSTRVSEVQFVLEYIKM